MAVPVRSWVGRSRRPGLHHRVSRTVRRPSEARCRGILQGRAMATIPPVTGPATDTIARQPATGLPTPGAARGAGLATVTVLRATGPPLGMAGPAVTGRARRTHSGGATGPRGAATDRAGPYVPAPASRPSPRA